MPGGRDYDDSDDGGQVPKKSLMNRLRGAFVKPVDPNAEPAPVNPPRTADELGVEMKTADDKERLIGLIAAPVAAIIGIVITNVAVSDDPAAFFSNGLVNPKH